MLDFTANTLGATKKALTDVIGPVVDENDALALEQLRLLVEYIDFVQLRIDDIDAHVRADLMQAVVTASKIVQRVDGLLEVSGLISEVETGKTLLGDPEARQQEIKLAALNINEALTELIRDLPEEHTELRAAIQKIVLVESGDMIQYERSWFLPFGFDPEPTKALPLREVHENLYDKYLAETEKQPV